MPIKFDLAIDYIPLGVLILHIITISIVFIKAFKARQIHMKYYLVSTTIITLCIDIIQFSHWYMFGYTESLDLFYIYLLYLG
jgi:hypothetical protein